jgi:hypothetical protein
MRNVTALRRTFPHTARLDATPETLFPLFCPVREYDWIEGWSCELVHAPSGAAEEGVVFRTPAPHDRGTMTWVVTRHSRSHAIDFACVAEGLVMRLMIRIAPEADGSVVQWTREFTATDAAAAAWLAALPEAGVAARTALLFERLAHYARTGEMLRATP